MIKIKKAPKKKNIPLEPSDLHLLGLPSHASSRRLGVRVNKPINLEGLF
jgi:hypothetical protein